MIYSYRRFKELIEGKEKEFGRQLSLVEIADGAQVSLQTVRAISNNACASLTLGTVDRFMRYFGITDVRELLEYEPDGEILPEIEVHNNGE